MCVRVYIIILAYPKYCYCNRYSSEKEHADRNYALAYFLKENKVSDHYRMSFSVLQQLFIVLSRKHTNKKYPELLFSSMYICACVWLHISTFWDAQM